jgi:hypothetical protein
MVCGRRPSKGGAGMDSGSSSSSSDSKWGAIRPTQPAACDLPEGWPPMRL